MTTITLKNIPDDLYAQLKESATRHRRSISQEIIYCIEQTVCPHPIDVHEHLERARQIRERLTLYITSDEEITQAKNEGRP